MTSPSGPARPGAAPRRRQRSTRLVVAVVLLALAGVAVAGAVLSGSWLVLALAAAAAVVLGAAATRITSTEVADTRRAWARDRAEQAAAYARITEARTAEQAVYVADTSGRIARHEATITRLERRLADAAAELTAAQDQAAAVQRASAAERRRLSGRLDDAEERAALAVVRVAELEQELDIVRAELDAWQATGVALERKRA